MTAFASNILAALPGVGAKPGAGGLGSAEGMAGGFESLLAALIGEAASLAQGAGGGQAGQSGSTSLPLLPGSEKDSDQMGQASAETLLASVLPFAAPVAPPSTVAAPEAKGAPVVTAAANVIAAAVDAAVDAALPAPAEVAVDAVANVVMGLMSEAATVEPAEATAPNVPEKARAATEEPVATPRSAFAVAAGEWFGVADRISPSNGPKSGAEGAKPAPLNPRAAGIAAQAPASAVATAPAVQAAEPEAFAAAATVASTPDREAARTATPTADRPASSQIARAIVEAAGAVVTKGANADAPARPTVARPAPVAAPQAAAETAVAVTASAIAQAAAAPAETTPPVTPEVAAAMAQAAPKAPVASPVEMRRTARSVDARASLEGDPAAPRAEKGAFKTAEVEAAGFEAVADATPDALAAPVEFADADAAPLPASEGQSAEPAVAAAATRHAEAAPVVRGSPETVARLAADIVQKLNGQNSKFDLQLDPFGLGKVDVSVEINADGRLTAALSFDSAAAAADLRGRSAELRQMLQQAGFDVSDSSLSFDMAGQNPGFGGREAGDQSRGQWSGGAFQTAQAGLDDADARLTAALSNSSRTPSGGVDIRI